MKRLNFLRFQQVFKVDFTSESIGLITNKNFKNQFENFVKFLWPSFSISESKLNINRNLPVDLTSDYRVNFKLSGRFGFRQIIVAF